MSTWKLKAEEAGKKITQLEAAVKEAAEAKESQGGSAQGGK